jgi:hypothetical protein
MLLTLSAIAPPTVRAAERARRHVVYRPQFGAICESVTLDTLVVLDTLILYAAVLYDTL